jgi:hypothetical protein
LVVAVTTWDGATEVEIVTTVGALATVTWRYATAPGAAGTPVTTGNVPAGLAARTVTVTPGQ